MRARTRDRRAPVNLDIAIEADWPDDIDWEALAAKAAAAAARVAPALAGERLQASILYADDATLQALNREWRGKDRPTNVLSFPMLEREQLLSLPQAGPPEMIGDLALSLETCKGEAAEKSVILQDHAAHLLVHGLLHLAGYDHETGQADAEIMEALETKALAIMGIEDPYTCRDIE